MKSFPGLRLASLLAALGASEVRADETTIPLALDVPAGTFSQIGNSWGGVTDVSHDGVDSARGVGTVWLSGTDNTLSTVVNGPGALSFWYRCEARPSDTSDRCLINFHVGTSYPQQPTEQFTATAWTRIIAQVPGGPQKISWLSLRPPGLVDGDRPGFLYVYLDELEFTPTPVPPQSTFAAWRTAWNVAGQPTSADIDGDGLTLLMEYASGGSPYAANPELVPVVAVSAGYFTINVIKAPSPTDLLYFVQASKDLAPNSWTTSSVEVVDEDGTHILAHCKKPISEQPISYLRVRVLVAP